MSTTRAARESIVSAFVSVLVVCVATPPGAAQAPAPAGSTATTRARAQVPTRSVQVPTVDMPNLVGQSYQAALRDPSVVKFRIALTPRQAPSTRTAGTVVGQDPPAGAPIRAGASAIVLVAVAPPSQGRASRPPDRDTVRPDVTQIPLVRVPRVEGLPEGRALEELSRLNFEIVRQTAITVDQKPGIVIAQAPEAGTPVRPRSSVRITVARARPTDDVGPNEPALGRMPNLVGQPFDVAVRRPDVRELRLRLEPQLDPTAPGPPGTVLKQSVLPGAGVEVGRSVAVLVATGAPVPPVTPPVRPDPVLMRMPDLVGRSFTLAEQHPEVLGARLRLEQQFDATAPGLPGTIVRQSVPAGTGVEVGRSVAVLVSTGVAVPLVLKQASGVAERQIAAAGLRPAVSNETSELEPGTVIAQVPAAGVMVSRGASVAITVAVAARVTVPDVIGRTRVEADQELTRLKLRVVVEDDALSASEPGRIVTQQPASGADVATGATVRVGVATGVIVPRVTGLSAEDAQRAVSQRGLSFEDADVVSDQVPVGRVLTQQPAAGLAVARGSRVRVALAVAPLVAVPDVVGLARDRAVALAEATGLVVSVQSAANQAGTAGVVSSQEPQANARVARGTAITLFLPLPRSTLIAVPNVVGLERVQAEAALTRLGLGARTTEADNAAQANTVVSQSPDPNVQVAPGSQIALVVARQAAQVSAPVVPTPPPTTAPVIPVWLTPLLVVFALVGWQAWRFTRSDRAPTRPLAEVHAATPRIDLEPQAGEQSLRLEVFGRSLVDLEVRVRATHDQGEQSLQTHEETLIADERRVYE